MVNDAVMMHKCLKGMSPSYLSHKFSTPGIVYDRQTRYRDSLNIPSCRINAGQRAFSYRGVKMWNNLCKDLIISSSSAPGKIGLPRPKPEKYSQKIALLPIAPKFGTKEVNRFSQSPA